jgi:hypothetical protein
VVDLNGEVFGHVYWFTLYESCRCKRCEEIEVTVRRESSKGVLLFQWNKMKLKRRYRVKS